MLNPGQSLSVRVIYGDTLVLRLDEKREGRPTAHSSLELPVHALSTDPSTQAEQIAKTIEALQRRLPEKK